MATENTRTSYSTDRALFHLYFAALKHWKARGSKVLPRRHQSLVCHLRVTVFPVSLFNLANVEGPKKGFRRVPKRIIHNIFPHSSLFTFHFLSSHRSVDWPPKLCLTFASLIYILYLPVSSSTDLSFLQQQLQTTKLLFSLSLYCSTQRVKMTPINSQHKLPNVLLPTGENIYEVSPELSHDLHAFRKKVSAAKAWPITGDWAVKVFPLFPKLPAELRIMVVSLFPKICLLSESICVMSPVYCKWKVNRMTRVAEFLSHIVFFPDWLMLTYSSCSGAMLLLKIHASWISTLRKDSFVATRQCPIFFTPALKPEEKPSCLVTDL